MNTLFQEKIRFWLKQCKDWWLPQQEKLKKQSAPYLEKLRSRWQSLNPREQSTLLGGALVTAILLFYVLIWSPLNTQLDDLRTQIPSEKKTAIWMKAADKQIRSFTGTPTQTPTKLLSQRLHRVQDELRQGPFSKNLSQLTQNNTDEIHCIFNSVAFDALIAWLIPFTQQHDLTIKQASIRKLNNIGLVQAEFVLHI